MGNIGGELAAVLLGSLFFRYIEGQYDYACRFAIRCYAAYIELIYESFTSGVYLAVTVLERSLYGYTNAVTAVHGKEIPTDAGGLRTENLNGGGIYAEYAAAVIQKYKTLVHTGCYLGELVGALFKLPHLRGYLVVLPVYAVEQRRQFFI